MKSKFEKIIAIVTAIALVGTFVLTIIQKQYTISFYVFLSIFFFIHSFLSDRDIDKLISAWKESKEEQYRVNNSILEHSRSVIENYDKMYSLIHEYEGMIIKLSNEVEKYDSNNEVLTEIENKLKEKDYGTES